MKSAQPHDQIFRHSMLLPKVALQFLEAWLPPKFLALVDWSTLSVQKISGTDESLKERREDVVYENKGSSRHSTPTATAPRRPGWPANSGPICLSIPS